MGLRWTRDVPAVRDMPGTYVLEIYDDQFSSAATEFEVEPPAFELEVSENITGLSPTEARVRVIEDSPGQFSDIFGADESRFRLVITYQGNTYYEGYALPDFYGDSPNETVSRTELVFSDMARWQGQYYTATGTNDGPVSRISNDSERLNDVVGKCLNTVGATGQFYVASNWYAHDVSNPFRDYHIDEAVFRDENDDPRTIFGVLDHVARSLGLLVRQKGGEFYFEQLREKSQSTYELQPFDVGATATAGTLNGSYSNSFDISTFQETRRRRNFTSPTRRAEAGYSYGDLGGELLRNAGFEQWDNGDQPRYWNSLNTNYTARADSPDSPDRMLWIDGVFSTASKIDVLEYDQQVVLPPTKQQQLTLSWKARYPNAGYLQNIIQPVGGTYNQDFAAAKVQIGSYYLQQGTVTINGIDEQKKDVITYDIDTIAGTSTGELLMPEGAVLQNTFDFSETLDRQRDAKGLALERPLRVGDTKLVVTIEGEYDETDFTNSTLPYWYWDTSSSYIPLGGLIEQFVTESIQTYLVAPDGTPVSGALSVTVRTPETGDNASFPFPNAAAITELSLDLSGPTSDGITWAAIDNDVRGETRESDPVIIGTGPTENHPGAVRIPDGSGGYELAGDWKLGAYSGGSPTGDTLEQLRAVEELAQFIQPRERVQMRLDQESGSPIDPTGIIHDPDTGDRYLIESGRLMPSEGRYEVRALNLAFGTASSLAYETEGAGAITADEGISAGLAIGFTGSFSRRTAEAQGVTVLTTRLEDATAVTSIDIDPIGEAIFNDGDTIILQSLTSGTLFELTLSADQGASDTTLSIDSFTPDENVAAGSLIYRGGLDLNSYISQTDRAISLFTQSGEVCKLDEDISGAVRTSINIRSVWTNQPKGTHLLIIGGDDTDGTEIVLDEELKPGMTSVSIQEQVVTGQSGDSINFSGAALSAGLRVQPHLVDSYVQKKRDDESIAQLSSSVSGTITSLPVKNLSQALSDTDKLQVVTRSGSVYNLRASGSTSAGASTISIQSDTVTAAEDSHVYAGWGAASSRLSVELQSITADTNIFKERDWDGTVDEQGNITAFATTETWALTGAGHVDFRDGSGNYYHKNASTHELASAGKTKLDLVNETLTFGDATDPTTGVGVFIGDNAGTYEIRAGDPSGEYFQWDGTNVKYTGQVLSSELIGSLTIQGSGAITNSNGDYTLDPDGLALDVGTNSYNAVEWIESGGTVAFIRAIAGAQLQLTSNQRVRMTSKDESIGFVEMFTRDDHASESSHFTFGEQKGVIMLEERPTGDDPDTPPSGQVYIYARDAGVYSKDSAGSVDQLG